MTSSTSAEPCRRAHQPPGGRLPRDHRTPAEIDTRRSQHNSLDSVAFAASYGFVELYPERLTIPSGERESHKESWPEFAHLEFEELAARMEYLHRFNAHKYVAGSPAIHLSGPPAAVLGAWGHGRCGIDNDLRTQK
ncbi:hypothetical protein [Streptomyces virginiae]|uniref:hypothetical protein n=1 Tax=Streptomyces virginiae TaxID=1961 RepID=UPI002E29BFEE|nr:hypothetical protein [Streptomyces virginiae]